MSAINCDYSMCNIFINIVYHININIFKYRGINFIFVNDQTFLGYVHNIMDF